jgi:hypothetical protein
MTTSPQLDLIVEEPLMNKKPIRLTTICVAD